MKYTIKQFQVDFPNNDVCLDYVFSQKYPNAKQYYRVKGRKCYANPKGKQIHPLKGTIFEKSSTSLTNWLFAIFLMSQSKNGVSAKELERQLGVTYKCAWRMGTQIRSLMKDEGGILSGTVEVDETYFGRKGKGHANAYKTKTALMGMVERGGRIRVKTIEGRDDYTILKIVKANVSKDSTIMSDEFSAYKKLHKFGYDSRRIKHGKKVYARGNTHTNTIEGFWGQLKRGLNGTYHYVSPKYLQSYADEFAFRYSHLGSPRHLFHLLMGKI